MEVVGVNRSANPALPSDICSGGGEDPRPVPWWEKAEKGAVKVGTKRRRTNRHGGGGGAAVAGGEGGRFIVVVLLSSLRRKSAAKKESAQKKSEKIGGRY